MTLTCIHLDFSRERVEKICDIKKNVKESIVVLLSAMHQFEIPLEFKESEKSRDFVLKQAGNPDVHITNVRMGCYLLF